MPAHRAARGLIGLIKSIMPSLLGTRGSPARTRAHPLLSLVIAHSEVPQLYNLGNHYFISLFENCSDSNLRNKI